jgi:hypothetical protein
VSIALAALALVKVVLKIRIARSGFCHCGNRTRSQRGAREVGVQNHARGVDYAAQRWSELRLDGSSDASGNAIDTVWAVCRRGSQLRAQLIENASRGPRHDASPRLLDKRNDDGLGE